MEPRVYKTRTKNEFNLDEFIHDYDPVSLTVPDQSLTLRQIVYRYASGNLPIGLAKDVVYDGDEEDNFVVDPLNEQNFDLTDMQEYERELRDLSEKFERVKAKAQNVAAKIADENKPSDQTSPSTNEV